MNSQSMTINDQTMSVLSADESALINRLAEIGVAGVERRLQWLSNYNDSIEIDAVRSGYVDPAAADDTFRGVELVGGRVALSDVPYGYALALFPPESANNAASLLLSTTVDDLDAVSPEMARSALSELSGMMINGFFDGWANRFDEEISLSEPEPLHNTEQEILRRTIGGKDTFGVYLAARVVLPSDNVTGLVYLFPHNGTFLELVDRLDEEDLE